LAERSRFYRGRSSQRAQAVVVIGLGRFGSAVATTLNELGHDVLGIDESPSRIAALRDALDHVVEADCTDPVALDQVGIKEFDRAVVAIGSDIEASILTTAALADLGLPDIWAKAMTAAHARILDRVGAHHVVFPEAQMGERVAHLVAGRMLDFLPLDEGFALVETVAPASVRDRSLGELGVRKRYGITVVCVKPAGGQFTYATADTVLGEGDVIVVAGATSSAEKFATLD
jgi:trk system potassium uptake protein TrkA